MGKGDALTTVEDAANFDSEDKGANVEVVGAILTGIENASLDILIGRIQDIDDTLETVKIEIDGEMMTLAEAGKRKEVLRAALKESMGSLDKQVVNDEETGKTAKLRPSYSEVWDIGKLRTSLKPKQRKLVIVPSIDHGALKKLIDTGAVSHAKLEVDGAVTKKLRSVSLFIRDTQEDDEE